MFQPAVGDVSRGWLAASAERSAAYPHEVSAGVAGRLLPRLDRAHLVEARLGRGPSGCRVVDVVVNLDAIDPGVTEASLGEGQRGRGGVADAGVRTVNPVADLVHVRSPTRHETARPHDIARRREHGEVEVLASVPFAPRSLEIVGHRVE